MSVQGSDSILGERKYEGNVTITRNQVCDGSKFNGVGTSQHGPSPCGCCCCFCCWWTKYAHLEHNIHLDDVNVQLSKQNEKTKYKSWASNVWRTSADQGCQ